MITLYFIIAYITLQLCTLATLIPTQNPLLSLALVCDKLLPRKPELLLINISCLLWSNVKPLYTLTSLLQFLIYLKKEFFNPLYLSCRYPLSPIQPPTERYFALFDPPWAQLGIFDALMLHCGFLLC